MRPGRWALAGAGMVTLRGSSLFAQASKLDLEVETAVTRDGHATDDWLAIHRSRLDDAQYDAVAPL